MNDIYIAGCFYPKPSNERWWYVIEVAPRGARIYENYNLITVADAETEVAQLPEDDVAHHLDDVDFSLGGELTIDLVVGIELCQDAVENT